MLAGAEIVPGSDAEIVASHCTKDLSWLQSSVDSLAEHETLSGGARQSGVRVRQLSARRQERQGVVESTIPIGGRNGGAGTH